MSKAFTRDAPAMPRGAAAIRRRAIDGGSRRRLVRDSLLGSVLLVLILAAPVSAAAFPGFASVAGPAAAIVTDGPTAPGYSGAAGNTVFAPDSGTITLTSSRTIIDFAHFELAPEDTLNVVFPSRNDTVLIRVANVANIAGTLNAFVGTEGGSRGGNIWIVGPDGVIFGPSSHVEVGGLLATTADIADLDFLQSDFGSSDNDFTFAGGASGAPIHIQGNTSIEGHGGVLAFIGAGVMQEHDAFVGADQDTATFATQADTEVVYGSAGGYTLTFAEDAADGADLLSFVIPLTGSAGNGIALFGTTRAGEIFIASVADGAGGPPVHVDGLSTLRAGVGGDVVVSVGGGLARPSEITPMQTVATAGAGQQQLTLRFVSAEGGVRADASGAIVVEGQVFAREDVVLVARRLLRLSGGAQVRGSTVALSTNAEFVNDAGPDAVSATDHWVVYALGASTANVFGGLDSHNTALWGADIVTRPPATVTGNRYVFQEAPVLRFTSRDATKVFGEDASGALTYSVSGYHEGVSGAFLGDDATTAYSGTPLLGSPGAHPAAPVDGSPYPIDISQGSLQSAAGYEFAFDSSGQLTVTRAVTRSLPMVVSGSTSWLLRDALTTGSATTTFSYGAKPLVPIMGDWDGDGSRTPGTFEAGTFKLRNDNGAGPAELSFTFGDPRGYPIAGDWNGDGRDDVAVYRNGMWQFRYADGDAVQTTTRSFGSGTWPTTVPVAGDWDGDGVDTIGTYTYATGIWHLTNDQPLGNGATIAPFVYWQGSGSYPVVGDWDGDGTDTVGVKKAATWSLNDANDDSGPDVTFAFGGANDLPLSWRP